MLLVFCKVLISWICVKLLIFNLLRFYVVWMLEYVRGCYYSLIIKKRLWMVLNGFFFFFDKKKKIKVEIII